MISFRLDPDKTKILVIAPPSIQSEIYIRGIFTDKGCIRFVDSAKDLGVIIDSVLSYELHVSKVVQICFGFLRMLHNQASLDTHTFDITGLLFHFDAS